MRTCVCSVSAGCNNCGGKGYKDCTTCGGSGMIACKTCNSSNKNSEVQETKTISTQPTNGETVANSEDGIHLCSECKGEGRTGICSNCKGDGYDKNTKQICVACLTTGKNRCDVCDGYGMLDSNGKGVAANDTPVVNRTRRTILIVLLITPQGENVLILSVREVSESVMFVVAADW